MDFNRHIKRKRELIQIIELGVAPFAPFACSWKTHQRVMLANQCIDRHFKEIISWSLVCYRDEGISISISIKWLFVSMGQPEIAHIFHHQSFAEIESCQWNFIALWFTPHFDGNVDLFIWYFYSQSKLCNFIISIMRARRWFYHLAKERNNQQWLHFQNKSSTNARKK